MSQLVSVVIPAYNSEATLARSIESALRQSYRPLEILVVDDCSTDGTSRIAEGFAARGVRLVRLERQSGASGARNAGIEAADGDLVAFLDSDDEWLPSKIEKQVALFATDERITLVSCAANVISSSGRDLGDIYGGHRPTTGPDAWKALLATNFIATPTVLARRRQLLEAGSFDPRLKIGEDQDMWIRLAMRGNVAYISEVLVLVHIREKSLSNTRFEDQLQYTLPMIRRHIANAGDRLDKQADRKIMGERLHRLGRGACNSGLYWQGLRMMAQSMAYGHRPLQGVMFLITAAPPVQWLKRLLRSRLAA